MTDENAQPACQWTDSAPCQFSGELDVAEYQGRYYCKAHAPLGSTIGYSAPALAEFIRAQQKKGKNNFDGLVVRYGKGINFHFSDGAAVTLTHAQLEGSGAATEYMLIQFNGDADLAGCVAHGNVWLQSA